MNSINERWAVPSSVPRPRMRGGAPFNKRNSVGIPTASASPAWKRTVSTTSAQREQLTSLQELRVIEEGEGSLTCWCLLR
jgi:hypothetical protein